MHPKDQQEEEMYNEYIFKTLLGPKHFIHIGGRKSYKINSVKNNNNRIQGTNKYYLRTL